MLGYDGCMPLPDARRRQALLNSLGAVWAVCAAGAPMPSRAWGADPVPQCGKAAPPPFPPVDKPPLIQCWVSGGRQDGPLPDCSPLRLQDAVLVIRLSASYVAPGTLDDQLAHVGAVSMLKGMPYWSFTDKQRQPLIREAYAIESAESMKPRADFSVAELRRGQDVYFAHSDNRSSALVPFVMRLTQQDAQGFSMRVESLGDVKFMGLTVLAAHEIQWGVRIEHLGGNRFGYRSLLGLRRLRMGGVDRHRQSNLARAAAMFDLLSGRVTEIESYR